MFLLNLGLDSLVFLLNLGLRSLALLENLGLDILVLLACWLSLKVSIEKTDFIGLITEMIESLLFSLLTLTGHQRLMNLIRKAL